MKSERLRLRPLAAAVAASIAAFALSSPASLASPPINDSPRASGHVIDGPLNHAATARYIVRFAEAPVVMYNGSAIRQPVGGIGSIPLKKGHNGRLRLDVGSAQAKAYVAYLNKQQNTHLADIAAAIGHAPKQLRAMQYALNAAIVGMLFVVGWLSQLAES